MYAYQRDFVFKPSADLKTPDQAGLPNVTARTVQMADGTDLLVWQAPPANLELPTVLYFHGQSGSISDRDKRYAQILDSGYGLLAVSYRGFAGSSGEPSEEAFVRDGIEIFDQLRADGANVIIHGESLGTGVAAAVAKARPDTRLLVLEAPYTAAVDIAAERHPWLPVSLLMRDPFVTRDRLPDVASPVLIVHGTQDRIIPYEHGEALYKIAPEPKRMLKIEGAGHGNLWPSGLWPAVLKADNDFNGS
ncbi:alpha/beta hydrolase [Roseibium sp. RKSG952]|nr:alpha/beta hydrolase [Roseibium sp. RKSG952]